MKRADDIEGHVAHGAGAPEDAPCADGAAASDGALGDAAETRAAHADGDAPEDGVVLRAGACGAAAEKAADAAENGITDAAEKAEGGEETGDAAANGTAGGTADDAASAAANGTANDAAPAPLPSAPRRARRLSGRARIAVRVCLALLAVLVVVACVVAGSVAHFTFQAKATGRQVAVLASQISAGDKATARTSAASIAASVEGLSEELSGPVWAALSCLPAVGGDIAKLRSMAVVCVDLCDNALVPYVEALPEGGGVQLVRADKSIDAAALATLVRPLSSASSAIKRSAEEVDQMGGASIGRVDELLRAAKTGLSLLDGIAGNAQAVADDLPGLLGENGERCYLLVAQQNAEVRSTGGFWGSAGLVYMRNGKLELGEFSSGARVSNYLPDGAALSETEEEQVLFGERICFIAADINFIPDFPTAASRYREMWVRCGQPDVQGLVALDPVFLQQVLSLTGGITTQNGTVVDGTNAARILEHDVYYDLPVKEQDDFFAEVAKGAFNKLMNPSLSIDGVDALAAIGRAFDNRRLQVWMADEQEEDIVCALGCSGEVSRDVANPTIGVYFNNSSYSKLSWWLKADTEIGAGSHNADGSTSYRVTTTMTNTMTQEEEGELPKYVAASNTSGVCPTAGTMALWTYIYAPAGATVANMTANASFADVADVEKEAGLAGDPGEGMSLVRYDGRDVWFGVVQLSPGESATLSYTVTTPSGNELSVDMTPLGQSEDK